ncbi:dihydrofolate reductase family protein [Naasia sp. SYSU D00057]|uniref:dihydrofolate reductase family protein n=1 Tax=Naasia sp. SYSU D00057 TaxID=2817380 RepID=UPI001B30B240|nr:dihydrofolate reductase family protein [Naasia sp. SYSU D00057]
MGRLVAQQIVSVDGFAADRDGGLEFFGDGSDWSEIDRENDAWLGGVGRILLGARTYRLFVEYWPTATELLARRINTIPKTVFSSTLEEAPWGEWEPAQLERRDPIEVVRDLRASSDGDVVLWGSLTLFRSLLEAGQIDEVQLRVLPVALGEGTPLFDRPARLVLHEATVYAAGIPVLSYGPGD